MELNDKIIRDLAEKIDENAYPETAEFLRNVLEDDFLADVEEMWVASRLRELDTTKPVHPEVTELVMAIYNSEIEKGNHYAMCDLGSLYYVGRGIKQDFEKAVFYYTMAEEHGNIQAAENLGYCYYYGRVGEPDYKKAFLYFLKGALLGYVTSMYKTGDMYKNGYYVKQDYVEALRIYRDCIERMNEYDTDEFAGPVYLRLGEMYLKGLGCEKDARTALMYYHKAQYYLYGMVENGDYFYKNSLFGAIAGEQEAWKELQQKLPDLSWSKHNIK